MNQQQNNGYNGQQNNGYNGQQNNGYNGQQNNGYNGQPQGHWQNQNRQQNNGYKTQTQPQGHWQDYSHHQNNRQNNHQNNEGSGLTPKLRNILDDFAKKIDLNATAEEVFEVLTQTCFKQKVTDSQMIALLLIAQKYDLDPFTGEIYAFPTKNNGIVPIVGVNGWSKIINNQPQCDGIEFRLSEDKISIKNKSGTVIDVHTWVECVIYRKDRSRPIIVREYLTETYKPEVTKYNNNTQSEYTVEGPWQSHPNRMLRHKALIQCARYAFSFTGIYDHEDGLATLNAENQRTEKDVSPQQPPENQRTEKDTNAVQPPESQQAEQEDVKDPENYSDNFKQQDADETVIENDNRKPLPQHKLDDQLKKIEMLIKRGGSPEEGIHKILSTYALTKDQLRQIEQITAR